MRRFLDINFVQQWETIGGKRYFFKSTWEINYARWLQWLKENKQIQDWFYEIETFEYPVKKGIQWYCPDFQVRLLKGGVEYHEIKGYMDQQSKMKLRRFLKFYPEKSIKLVTGEWFKKYDQELRAIIPEWL